MRKFACLCLVGLISGVATEVHANGGGGGGMAGAPSATAPAYDPAADYAQGVAAVKAGQYREGSRALKRVVHAAPKNIEAWRLLGESAAGEGDWKTSRKAYEQAVKLSPDDVVAHAGLGVAMARLKDGKAQGELDWLTAHDKACQARCADSAALKAALAKVQAALSGTEAARSAAALDTPMIFAGPAAGDLAYSAAVGLINQHRYDEALAELSRAQAVFGPHPDILTYEGYAWRKKGDYGRAESYYRQALAIAPAHRGAREYYGELKVERGDLTGARLMLAKLETACAFGCAEAEELRAWIDHRGDPQAR